MKRYIGIAVSFDGLSNCAYKIVTTRIVGSMATMTTVVDLSKDGTICTLNLDSNKTLSINGTKVTVVTKENGND